MRCGAASPPAAEGCPDVGEPGGAEGERWGWLNKLSEPETLRDDARALARELANGPTFANGITKTMLHQEWAMTIEQAIAYALEEPADA